MADWSPTKVENLVERDAWVGIDHLVPYVSWFWRGLVRYCTIECCGFYAFDLTEDSVRWASGEDVPDADDRGWRSDEPGDPGALADQFRVAAQQVRGLGVPAVCAHPIGRVLTAESYGSLFDSLAVKLDRVGSEREPVTDSTDERATPPPEKVFSTHRLDRSKLPTTDDECRRAISAAATTLDRPKRGSAATMMIMSEGRALARRVAGSEATKGITDGLLEAQGFLVSFVGSRTGQMTTIALAGTPAGRELAATITEMPSARQIAALLGRSSEGLDEVVALARSPVGRGLAESLCQIESSLTYAADVAQAEPGHLIAQYLADSSRALPLICSAAARDEETLAVFRQIAATRTCHDLATALAATASGRDLAEAMYLSDPAREIIRTVELTSQSSFDGNTDTAGLASSCIMMQIAVQFSVITAGLVFYVAVNAATD